MIPILYEANTTSFTTNGLGRLSDCISCVVQETINGIYELELVYPVGGKHYEDIAEHCILSVVHDDTQTREPFEIYRISRPINNKVTVNAWHISYRLRKMVCTPFTATGVADAINEFGDSIVGTNPFTFATDKTSGANMAIKVPCAAKSVMGGMQGSLIDVYGGEWEYSGYTCTLRNRRGTDTDIEIRYGKNLTDIQKTTDATNFWTGIIPYWTGQDSNNTETVVVYNGVIYSSARSSYPYDMVIPVDASGDFQGPPTQAQLQSWGSSYITANARTLIPTTINISFVALWQTEEFKNVAALQRLFLGDTVEVNYDALGVHNTARIVAYKYNVLLERYDSMTLGQVKSSFTSAVKGDIDAIVGDIESNLRNVPTYSYMDAAIDHATELITGGLGGYVVINTNANGEPIEILIMDTPDIATAVNVWRFNSGGLGHSHSGYDGPFNDVALTADGKINADMITVGTMLANRIMGGTLTLGGSGNGNGVLVVKDANGTEIGRWNNVGITINKGTIQGPTIKLGGANNANGQLLLYDNDGNQSGVWDKDGFKYTQDVDWSTVGGGSGTRKVTLEIDETCIYIWGQANTNRARAAIGLFSGVQKASFISAYPRDPASAPLYISIPEDGAIYFCRDYTSALDVQFLIFDVNHSPQINSSSSLRFKHDIAPIKAKKLDPHKLLNLEIVQFVFNDDFLTPQESYLKGVLIPGIIAEDVEKIYPSATIYDIDGRVKSWDERRIIPPMLKLIQEQHKEIEELKDRVARLEKLIGGLLNEKA